LAIGIVLDGLDRNRYAILAVIGKFH
jgi:fluoride ion exporter CrcB/FEX